jgi:hypothetical protein
MDPNTNIPAQQPVVGQPAQYGQPVPGIAVPQPQPIYQQPSQMAGGVPTQMPQQMGQPAYGTPQQPYTQQAQQPYAMSGQAVPMQPNQQQSQPPKPVTKSNPNSTQNSLQIAEIRDGIVIMNDGSFRSVVMAKSINFDLMSPEERDAVEYSYQGFLNSLYFPIQIFMRSQKIDLGPYIERLDKIRLEHDNMLLALLMEDYIAYITDVSQQTNIMDKKFYIVVPYFPAGDITKAITQSKSFFSGLGDLFSNKEQHVRINEADLNKAKDELRNRVQALLGGLQQCNIQALPLDTQELIELYYDTYNPDTATRQQLKNFEDLNAPVIEKGVGQAYQPQLEKELE